MKAVPPPPHVAVIGAGWGGWGAAKALVEAGVRVTLYDRLPDPTGKTPFLSKTGKPVEAGTRGFWKDYPNIERLLAELGISENEVFSPFTNSCFYSPEGLEATAPVFEDAPELPSPLGQVLATFALFERLPLADRVSIVGLLYAIIDFQSRSDDEELYARYDRMSAHELFLRFGLTKRLVDDFLKPTLLVGLFKPPEELSAAVVMELLYFYALAHQTSFDVRWIRRGTVSSSLLAPLAERLQELGRLNVKSASVESLEQKEGRFQIEAKGKGLLGTPGETVSETFDGVVLAVGAKGLRAVMGGSSALAKRCPELARASSLGSIDVMCARIWLDRYVATTAPANVWASFPQLEGAGGTFFMLDQLQDEAELWPGEEPRGSVISCDFYNASALLLRSDEEIIRLIQELLPSAVPGFAGAKVLDSWVLRAPGAVSWFSPGSAAARPPLLTSVPRLVCAGDWVRLGDREHGAKGLCQERALVSGAEAANALLRDFGGEFAAKQAEVLPVREDEPQVQIGRKVNKAFMEALKPFGLDSPWVR